MSTDDAVDETVQAAVAAAEAAVHSIPDPTGIEEVMEAAVTTSSDHQGGVVPPAKRRRTVSRKNMRPWNDMLFELLKYRQINGNVMVPFKSGGELGCVQLNSIVHLCKATFDFVFNSSNFVPFMFIPL